jgi:nickel-dependent lactate racemase
MLYFSRGTEHDNLSADDLKQGLYAALEKLGKRRKVMALPPDITRLHSRAGELTRYAWQYYRDAMTDVLPALGTHVPMTGPEIQKMFGEVPADLFRVHDWRNGFTTPGRSPLLVPPRGQRGQARLVLARPGQQADRRGRA